MKKIKNLSQKAWQFMQKRWKLLIFVLIIILGLGLWRYRSLQAAENEQTFEKVQVRDLEKKLEVSGVVDAKEKANMRFAAGGKITYLGAQEGDRVKKWQTIATIDRATLKKQLEQDLNNYLKERWDFERLQDDYDYHVEPLETRRTLDQEQWNLENQVLNVEIRDIAINNTVLSAPFNGVLVGSPVDTTGVTLLATDVFELVNPDTLVFKAAVDEADIALVNKGQEGKIYLDAYPDQAIKANIDYIAYKSQQSSTGTVFTVELPLTGDDLLGKYRLGMNGEVEILVEKKENVLTVPFIATRFRDGQYYVEVKNSEGQAVERQIEIGLETEDYVEVFSGLNSDDEILIPSQDKQD